MSSTLFEVCRCVQLNRWSVVCGCVLHRGSEGRCGVFRRLCRYDIRMGLLLVRSWARVRRVSLGRESSEVEILGGVLMYDVFVMVALQEVCLYYASVYLC